MIGYVGPNIQDNHQVCQHILETQDPDLCQYFTGEGIFFHIVCYKCAMDHELQNRSLKKVERPIFQNYLKLIKTPFDWESVTGDPEIMISDDLIIEEQVLKIPEQDDRFKVLHISGDIDTQNVLVLKQDILYHRLEFVRYLFYLVSSSGSSLYLEISESQNLFLKGLNFNKELIILYSSDFDLIVLANKNGQHAFVIKQNGSLVTTVDRGTYRIENCTFPLALISHQGQPILIHGSDWNRVDLLNLNTLENLTPRDDPKEYDYFHSVIHVSPDLKWIMSNGWVWSPVGVITYWKLEDWIQHSEAPESENYMKSLPGRDEWDIGLTWYSEDRAILRGYGSTDAIYHGATLIDLQNTEVIGWFPGPEGDLDYHRSSGMLVDYDRTTMNIWRLETGTRVFTKSDIRYQLLHHDHIYFIEDNLAKFYDLSVTN